MSCEWGSAGMTTTPPCHQCAGTTYPILEPHRTTLWCRDCGAWTVGEVAA